MKTKRSRYRRVCFMVGLVAACGFLPRGVVAAPVHIEVDTGRSTEHGAGFSVGKGTECFVVVPMHVVVGARKIVVTDTAGRSAEATPFQAPEGVDAALLKVENGHALHCPADWDDGSAGEAALHDAEFLVSRKAQQNGVRQRRLFLSSESSTELSLRPFSAAEADQLIEGDSGSSLYANNALVGMIYEVDTATGTSHAIKQTYLNGLFGNLVLEHAAKRALVNPVYYQFTENRYATVAVRNFIHERTALDVVEPSPTDAAAAVLGLQQGTTPSYPDDVDYVISTNIIENRSHQEANSNFDPGAAKESNFGRQILNALESRSARYINITNLDVEVQILTPSDGRMQRDIEQFEYKTPLTDNVDQRALETELTVRAVTDALKAALGKYGLPVLTQAQPEERNLLKRFFKQRKD